MSNEEKKEIRDLLIEFKEDKKVIIKLISKYNDLDIISVAFENKLDDIILMLFQPIEIDGEYQIFFDFYSTLVLFQSNVDVCNYLNKIRNIINESCEKNRGVKIKNSLSRKIPGWGAPIKNESDVYYYAEPACLETMLYLFRNNIVTVMNDTECVNGDGLQNGTCKVWILYDSLSDENKELVQDLINEGQAEIFDDSGEKTVSIFVPCSSEDMIGEVSDRLLNVAKKLKYQISERGLISTDKLASVALTWVNICLDGENSIPGGVECNMLFFEYIDEGLLKPLDLTEEEQWERYDELLEVDDKLFSVIDFIKLLLELNPEVIRSVLSVTPVYYDKEEDKYWSDKDYYDMYVESKEKFQSKKY